MKHVLLWVLLTAQCPAWAQDSTPGEQPADVPWVEHTWQTLRDQGLTGALRLDYFRSSRDLDDRTDFLGGTAQLKLTPSFNNALDGKLEARLTNQDVGGDGDTEATLLEGYVTAHFAHADLRIGKQIVAWGRADGVNPTDNLTPRNFTVLLPFEEDQRFGLTAVKLDYHVTPEYTVTFFITPFFEPTKVPRPSGQGEPIERRPARTLANSEFAFKLNRAGGALDWSVSYFHGYSTLPDARVLGFGPAGPVLELGYNKIDVVGADFARNFGRYGVRGELAYFFTDDREGRDPAVKNPFLYYVFGGDRTFFENLNINLQWVGRWVQSFTDPETIADPVAREVAAQNAITDGQQDRTSYGLSSRVGKKWLNDTLEAEILVFANFTRRNAYIRPLIGYAFTDHIKGTLGAEIYTGEEETAFGRIKRNRGAFAELRYAF